MKAWAVVACVSLAVCGGACRMADEEMESPVETVQPSGKSVTGTVTYLDLEGGFYGIVTDEGKNLDPVNLPDDFKEDGIAVRAYVETLEDRVSFRMWGELVKIHHIERL